MSFLHWPWFCQSWRGVMIYAPRNQKEVTISMKSALSREGRGPALPIQKSVINSMGFFLVFSD